MRYIRPVFYDAFRCTADQCPDTCCAGWQIMIDEDSLKQYEEVRGSFGKRLHNSIDWQEGCFYQYYGRCAFLNEQNLCDLYTALGSEALCDTCRKYPRHVEEYEGLREWSLSLSCPVAAKIILAQQGFPEFIVEEDEKTDELEEEFEDFDLLLFTQLEDARNAVFEMLRRDSAAAFTQNHMFGGQEFVRQNMSRALGLAKNMQECLEDGNFYEIEKCINSYQENKDSVKPDSEEESYEKFKKLYQIMYDLERLRPEWTDVLKEMYSILYSGGMESYVQLKKEFKAYLSKSPESMYRWENTGLQLFVFFLYTYFCGAVYDDWIYSKMALAVHSVEFIRELFLTRWKRTGRLDMEDYVELSYRYAREIEHSDQNLNDLEEIFWNIFQESIDN